MDKLINRRRSSYITEKYDNIICITATKEAWLIESRTLPGLSEGIYKKIMMSEDTIDANFEEAYETAVEKIGKLEELTRDLRLADDNAGYQMVTTASPKGYSHKCKNKHMNKWITGYVKSDRSIEDNSNVSNEYMIEAYRQLTEEKEDE